MFSLDFIATKVSAVVNPLIYIFMLLLSVGFFLLLQLFIFGQLYAGVKIVNFIKTKFMEFRDLGEKV